MIVASCSPVTFAAFWRYCAMSSPPSRSDQGFVVQDVAEQLGRRRRGDHLLEFRQMFATLLDFSCLLFARRDNDARSESFRMYVSRSGDSWK